MNSHCAQTQQHRNHQQGKAFHFTQNASNRRYTDTLENNSMFSDLWLNQHVDPGSRGRCYGFSMLGKRWRCGEGVELMDVPKKVLAMIKMSSENIRKRRRFQPRCLEPDALQHKAVWCGHLDMSRAVTTDDLLQHYHAGPGEQRSAGEPSNGHPPTHQLLGSSPFLLSLSFEQLLNTLADHRYLQPASELWYHFPGLVCTYQAFVFV